MKTIRTAGLILAAVASAMWIFIVVAFFLALATGAGVPFGLIWVAYLALPPSVAASVVLLVSLVPVGPPHYRPPAMPPLRRATAAALAVLSLFLLPQWISFPDIDDSFSSDVRPLEVVGGIAAFLGSSILFALRPSHRD